MSATALEQPADRVQETHFAALEPGDEAGPVDSNSKRRAQDYGSISGDGPPAGPSLTSNASKPSFAPSGRVLAPDLLRGLLMVLQSIDHAAMTLGPWKHGVASVTEGDSRPVDTWNNNVAWVFRTLTHLCAPGFMFLLGMGVVYFGKSRSKLGWSTYRMASHFAIRGCVLALVNEFLTLVIGRGQIAVVNIVLLALAFDYFFAGIFWLALDTSERYFSRLLALLPSSRVNEDEASSQPLLEVDSAHRQQKSSRAASISWHLHNVVLLVVAVVTIWWNIWLSPTHGHCEVRTSEIKGHVTSLGPWFDFWFFPIQTRLVISVFPPLAWISFALFGILYGRIVLARPWAASTINIGNALTSLAFALIFVATRLLHIGNLSENCLRMPEHLAHPHRNQYLASFKSFFYVTKYPPSVSFLAFSLSANFLFLAIFGALPPGFARRIPTLMTFGTSALFFYTVHLPLYMVLGMLVTGWFGHKLGYPDPIRNGREAVGVNLTAFWITWAVGIAILYPLCGWFGRFKRSKGSDSIWRFF